MLKIIIIKKTVCHTIDSSFIVKQCHSSQIRMTFKIARLCDENIPLWEYSPTSNQLCSWYEHHRIASSRYNAKTATNSSHSVSPVYTWAWLRACIYPVLNVNWWRLMQRGSCGDMGCRCSIREETRSWCLSK